MPTLFNKKQLRIVITLGNGNFGQSKNNVITLQGYRAQVDIDKAGGMTMGTLKAKIWGVSQSDMNACTVFNWKPQYTVFNTIQVYAIDGTTETLVFTGNVIQAWGDYQAQPDVFLQVQAISTLQASLVAVPPTSFKGKISVSAAMAQIAKGMGLAFENNGVNTVLQDVYLANTALEQAKELAKAAGCNLYIDNQTLAITPSGMPRGTLIPSISNETGLIGFPTFDGVGVNFRALYTPAITFGGAFELQTSVPTAKGHWIAQSIALELDSEKPNGRWFMQIRGTRYDYAIVK